MTQKALVEPRKSKLMIIEISPEFILDLLKIPKHGVQVDTVIIKNTEDRIPEDAEVLRCGISNNGCTNLIIEDKSFESHLKYVD